KNATDPASPPAPSPCAPHAAPAPDRPDTAPPSPSAAAPAPATAPRAGLLPPPGSLRYPDSCSLIALLDKQTHEKSHKLSAQGFAATKMQNPSRGLPMDWAEHGVKIVHSDELDLNTSQTSGPQLACFSRRMGNWSGARHA